MIRMLKIILICFFYFSSCISNNSTVQDRTETSLNESEKLNRYNELVSRGNQLLSVSEYQSAIGVFTEAIRIIPEKPVAYYRRAMAYYLWSKYPREYEQVIRDITTAIRYDPRNAEYFEFRGDAYFSYSDNYPITNIGRMSSDEYRSREYSHYITNMNNAISDYTTASRLDPTNYRYIFRRGSLHLFTKNWNKAIEDLTIAIENMDPNVMDYRYDISYAYRYRGMAFYEVGNNDLAANDFRQYSELSGNEYTIERYIVQRNREAEQNMEMGKRR